MRGKSHISLGNYLAYRYLRNVPLPHRKAFLLGCIQPDSNPATYLKGSIRCQWLRGHNYPNASRFIGRIARRLERKDSLNLFDFYTLGKLIHYTADAFTFPHNASFSGSLSRHREYEQQLQQYFLNYLEQDPPVDIRSAGTIMDSICLLHRQYRSQVNNIRRDSRFALDACCCVLAILLTPRMI